MKKPSGFVRGFLRASAFASALAAAQAYAVPTVADLTFGELLDTPTTITFNVHDELLAGGTPAPVYVQDGLTLNDAPASATVRRVGNACIEVSWGADNVESLPFTLNYSLIAGDRTTAGPGTIAFQRGNGQLTNVTDTNSGCDDPRNSLPTTTTANFEFNVGEPLVFPIITPDGPALDADGIETLRLTDEVCWEQPQNGTVSRVSPDSTDVVFTPATGFAAGSDSFSYCVTDNPQDRSTGVRGLVTFTVGIGTPTNEFVDDTAVTGFLEPVVIDVLANDTVQLGAFVAAVSSPAGGGFARILDRTVCANTFPGIETNCVEYSPPSSNNVGQPFFGDDTFTYTVGGGDLDLGSATVTVTVVPDDPVVLDDTASTDQDVGVVIDVRGNDDRQEGETLSSVSDSENGATIEIQSQQVCSATFIEISSACLRYTPAAGFTGTDTFTYTVSNGPASSTATVTVTVVETQTPTRALTPDTATTNVNEAVIIDILANDQLIARDTISAVGAPANGGTAELLDVATCVAIDSDLTQGCVRYTPPAADANGVVFVGDDTFTYTVSGDANDSDVSSVTVTVVAPDGTPEPIADDVAQLPEGESIEIDVLANDTDDGGAANLSIVSVTEPGNGSATINRFDNVPNTVTYTPNPGFVGTDSFFYTVSDGDPTTVDRAAEVTITVERAGGLNPLTSLALSPEEREIAGAIDTVCANLRASDVSPPPGPDPAPVDAELLTPGQQALLARCTALIEFANPPEGDNSDAVRDALRQIAGEEVFAQSTISTQILNTQINNIDSRLAALRGGARGINVQGLSLGVNGKTLPGTLFARETWSGGGASADGQPEDERGNALLDDSRLGLFMNGRLNFGDQGPTSTENGFDFETLGVTAGADYRFRNDFAAGFALGFANADVDYNNTSGAMDSDSLTYSMYGTYYTDKLYVDLLAGFGDIDFDSFRTLRFADSGLGVDTVALGLTEGDQTVISANFGYNLQRGGWLFVPFVGYDYINTKIDSYSETRGQGWELAFDAQDVESQIISAGVRMSYTKSLSIGVLVPHFRIASQHELETDQRVLTARFVNDPTNTRFRFFTDAPDSSFFQLATGVSMVMENGVSAYVDYETLAGYNNLKSSTLTLGVRFERRFK
ncbi:MAG: autotransporter domain-containing protein [Woeseiaceae bacterium]